MSQIPIKNNPTPPKRGDRVMAKDISDLWQAVKRLAAQQDTIRPAAFPNSKLAPLTVTLRRIAADPVTWEVFCQYGHVVPRHNASAETGEPIEVTGLPTPDAPLVVIEDDKLWVELTIDVEGKCTAAAFDSGTTWPEDTPPELIGGDDQSGTAGERYIRIAEIIANPDSTTTPAQLQCDQLHTGHVDHFQPTLIENLTTSPSGGEARVMKEWNTSSGRWDLRYLSAGEGSLITEDGDYITLNSFVSHPWRVTANSSTPASWDIIGDTVYGQGDPIVVANANVVGNVGYVVLKITRDESTREMTAAVVEFAASVTDSDYTYQYRVLAKVDKDGTPKVLQYQFEEIRIFEDMAAVNGEFQLLGLEMSHRNYYDPPA